MACGMKIRKRRALRHGERHQMPYLAFAELRNGNREYVARYGALSGQASREAAG